MKKLWDSVEVLKSSNKNVLKFVFKQDSAIAEAVLYKYPSYRERTVMCISTMSGCTMGCTFCGAGEEFIRNLTPGEIEEQVETMLEYVDCEPIGIESWQIMFMSMGEPFHNYGNVRESLIGLHEKYKYAKLLISTSAPYNIHWDDFAELSEKIDTIGLQFSVHESTDGARKALIPKGNTITLQEMADEGLKWFKKTFRSPYFNYCVHSGNNTVEDAKRLRSYFEPGIWEATLSVICEKNETMSQSITRQEKLARDFSNLLLDMGYSVRVFNPAGQDDIGGGCGQLWQVQKWMKEKAA